MPFGAQRVGLRGLGEGKGLSQVHAERAFRMKPRRLDQGQLGILLRRQGQLRAMLRRGKVGDGEDAGRIADQFDQLWDDARAGDIEGGSESPREAFDMVFRLLKGGWNK